MDRLILWIERIPVPIPVFYGGLYLLGALLIHLAMWIDGAAPWGGIRVPSMLDGVWLILGLGVAHMLSNASRRAVERFAPVLEDNQQALRHLRDRVRSMPARPVFWVSFTFGILVAVVLLSTSEFMYAGMSHPLSYAIALLIGPISYAFAPVMIYFSARTLNTVRYAFRSAEGVSLFDQEPLYAFAGVTFRASLLWLIIGNLNFLSQASESSDSTIASIDLGLALMAIAVAIVTFIGPLVGIHRRLGLKKQAALAENGKHLEALGARLYRAIDVGDVEAITISERTAASLHRLRDEIRVLPTWPWAPGTLRTFLTAVILPMLLWGAQQWATRVI